MRPRTLAAVPKGAPPPLDLARDIYADARLAALDSERWRRLHERSDRSAAISLAAPMRRLFSMKGGVRRERGGHKFEERA